jgi:NADH dehydrogenase [ubiquinone] 1 alpha subcomplex assembly factor 7
VAAAATQAVDTAVVAVRTGAEAAPTEGAEAITAAVRSMEAVPSEVRAAVPSEVRAAAHSAAQEVAHRRARDSAARDARAVRTQRLRMAIGTPLAARAPEQRREGVADSRVLAVRGVARRIRRVPTARGTRSAAAAVPEPTQSAHRVSEEAPHRVDLARPRGRSPAGRRRAASAVPIHGVSRRVRADSVRRGRRSPDAAARALRSGRASMEAARSEMPRSRAAADLDLTGAVSVGIADSAVMVGAADAGAAVSDGDWAGAWALAGV